MKRTTMLMLSSALVLGGHALAEVDLSANAIRFHLTGGAVAVQAEYGVWHDDAQGDYTVDVTLTQLRDGVPIATVWQTSHGGLSSSNASSCRRGCNVQSCTGSCSVGGQQGECQTMIENCDGKDGYRECLCVLKSASVTLETVQDGDVFRLSVSAVGAIDRNPSNNVLTVAFN